MMADLPEFSHQVNVEAEVKSAVKHPQDGATISILRIACVFLYLCIYNIIFSELSVCFSIFEFIILYKNYLFTFVFPTRLYDILWIISV